MTKRTLAIAALAAAYLAPGSVTPASAQQQVTETITCQSTQTTRSSCPVQGEILSAGINQQFNSAPCFLGFTWGFETNGIWTARGCSAEFAVTVERPQPQREMDPEVLRSRLSKTRDRVKSLRADLTRERDERKALESQLADMQAALSAAERGQSGQGGGRMDRSASQAVGACQSRAQRDAMKSGASRARVVEIVSAQPSEGSWLVIGQLASDMSGPQGGKNYFRCWTRKGELMSFEFGM